MNDPVGAQDLREVARNEVRGGRARDHDRAVVVPVACVSELDDVESEAAQKITEYVGHARFAAAVQHLDLAGVGLEGFLLGFIAANQQGGGRDKNSGEEQGYVHPALNISAGEVRQSDQLGKPAPIKRGAAES